MNKFNKGDWVATHRKEKGIVVGFQTTFFSEAGASEPHELLRPPRPPRPPRKPTIECAWVLLIGASSPYLFDLRFLERIEVNKKRKIDSHVGICGGGEMPQKNPLEKSILAALS